MILGVDVSKDKIDVALFEGKQAMGSGSFSNTTAGFKKLSKWLRNKKADEVWVCLEATGRYGEKLADYCFKAGHQVSMVNPARIKKYGVRWLLMPDCRPNNTSPAHRFTKRAS